MEKKCEKAKWLPGEALQIAGKRREAKSKGEREIKESIPFTIATKIIKYLGVNLTKETKELYTENYKTLVK